MERRDTKLLKLTKAGDCPVSAAWWLHREHLRPLPTTSANKEQTGEKSLYFTNGVLRTWSRGPFFRLWEKRSVQLGHEEPARGSMQDARHCFRLELVVTRFTED